MDTVSENDRTAVERPIFTKISNVSENGVYSVSSNDRTAVERPTFTGISNVSKNSVDSVSSNDGTAGATSKPQVDTSLGAKYCNSPLIPVTGAEG